MYLIEGYFLHCNVFTFKYMTPPLIHEVKQKGSVRNILNVFSDTAFVDQTLIKS